MQSRSPPTWVGTPWPHLSMWRRVMVQARAPLFCARLRILPRPRCRCSGPRAAAASSRRSPHSRCPARGGTAAGPWASSSAPRTSGPWRRCAGSTRGPGSWRRASAPRAATSRRAAARPCAATATGSWCPSPAGSRPRGTRAWRPAASGMRSTPRAPSPAARRPASSPGSGTSSRWPWPRTSCASAASRSSRAAAPRTSSTLGCSIRGGRRQG
mmetsp:Transcript_38624/g.110174  ORF Transcript_38624/g.110174 Transcript_38624/m.110174 type:complete len:213 (-) Transcript_38624:28-666(-)